MTQVSGLTGLTTRVSFDSLGNDIHIDRSRYGYNNITMDNTVTPEPMDDR